MIDDRLRDTFSTLDPDVTASPTAWSAITRRTTRRSRPATWTRRAGLALAPLAAFAALGVILIQHDQATEQVSTGDKPAGIQTTEPSSSLPPTTSPITSPPTTAHPAAGVPLQTVDWAKVVVLDCGSAGGRPIGTVLMQVAYPEPAPGTTVAVVMARCDASAGSPPTSLFVYDHASSTTSAHLLQVLMDGRRGSSQTAIAKDFKVAGSTLIVDVYGYSSADVPRCCPDRHYTETWVWQGGSYQQISN
jgi:hypothetical protein